MHEVWQEAIKRPLDLITSATQATAKLKRALKVCLCLLRERRALERSATGELSQSVICSKGMAEIVGIYFGWPHGQPKTRGLTEERKARY